VDLDRQLRRRLIRSEWHGPRSNGAALDAFEGVERQVGAGRVQLDDGETDWLAASWAGLTDLKLHGMSFRPTRLEDELGTTQTGPGEFVRSLNACDGVSVERIVPPYSRLSSANGGPVTPGMTIA
jgi:hypothetical protein